MNKLNSNDRFDADLKKYLEAIKYISEISVECIDLLEKRKEINNQLGCIVNFIKSYSKEYYEIIHPVFRKSNPLIYIFDL